MHVNTHIYTHAYTNINSTYSNMLGDIVSTYIHINIFTHTYIHTSTQKHISTHSQMQQNRWYCFNTHTCTFTYPLTDLRTYTWANTHNSTYSTLVHAFMFEYMHKRNSTYSKVRRNTWYCFNTHPCEFSYTYIYIYIYI